MEEIKQAKALFVSNQERKEVEMSLRFHHNLQLQSSAATATLNDTAPEEQTVINENIAFVHEGRAEDLTYQDIKDSTFIVDKSGTADLTEFLSRPVPIKTFTWAEGSSTLLQATIQPWSLFYLDTRIKKKLDNFAYIKSTLKLKFVINASPFYYGAIGAFYRPMSGNWDNLTSAATQAEIQIPISQRPHVWMNPQEVSTAEMTLPFFKHQNWLDATKNQDFLDMGTLDFWQYSKLRSANGAVGTGVTVTVYAWAEDVVVAGPTVALALQSRMNRARVSVPSSCMSHAGIELQSKKTTVGNNWWKPSGQVSQIASRVASVAPSLGKLGAAGEYAGKTIEAAANTVGSIASLFGFSNTPVIEDTMPFKSLPFHSLASTEISEPVERLCIDPKQSLDLDTTRVGLDGEDEMGISYIAQKESFLCGALWQDSFAADTLIFSSLVTPSLMANRSITGAWQRYTPPMAYISQLFENWRGDVIFRFKFIRSMYHRGRVRITWDPAGNISTDPNSTTVAYTQIVDLDVDDEIELRVPYIALRPFLKCQQDTTFNNNWTNTSGALAPDNTIANGSITLRVLNALTAPVTGTEIDVLVFVRGAENMEFANPRELNPRNSPFVVQSGEVITSGGTSSADDIYGAVYGERYVSFRQLLHRSCRIFGVKPYKIAGLLPQNIATWYIAPQPEMNGYDPNGMHMSTGFNSGVNARYNYVTRNPLNHLSQMFIGRRGSYNWHFNLDGSFTDTSNGLVTVERAPYKGSSTRRYTVATYDIVADNTNQVAYANVYTENGQQPFGSAATGVAMTNQLTQAGVSVNIPDYHSGRFHFNSPTNNFKDELYGGRPFTVTATMTNTELGSTTLHAFASAGPDFNFVFFMNTPDNYIYLAVPAYSATEAPVTATVTP